MMLVGVASWELGVGVLAWRKSWHSGRRLVGPSARWAGTCISISFLSLRAQELAETYLKMSGECVVEQFTALDAFLPLQIPIKLLRAKVQTKKAMIDVFTLVLESYEMTYPFLASTARRVSTMRC
jgi:hypothetical protein